MTIPRCNQCHKPMAPHTGIVPVWRCTCGREIPRETENGYLLRINDSTLQPDYQPGDHVRVEHKTTAEPGQVVVALVDGVASLRRWPVENARVLGVVTEMFRSLT